MVYVDSALARNFAFLVIDYANRIFQTPLIKTVQTCLKLKMKISTPLLTAKVTPMISAIYGKNLYLVPVF